MSTPDFNEIEQEATKEGGRAGYTYLDSIGKGDLFELQMHEALEFFERVIDGFGCHMRARLVADRDLPVDHEKCGECGKVHHVSLECASYG